MPSSLLAIEPLIADYLRLQDRFVGETLAAGEAACDAWTAARLRHDLLNHQEGHGYNPLRFVPLSENTQSRLIGDWLDPRGSHGQCRLFLNAFLDHIGITYSAQDCWDVSVEVGRVDILLKRRSSAGIVIIENKSNDAVDQDHQLYRYWYREIYEPFPDLDPRAPETASAFQIVYLTANRTKQPMTHSVRRPPDYPKNLPEELPLPPRILPLPDLAAHWRDSVLPNLPDRNHRLRSFLAFTLEHWTSP